MVKTYTKPIKTKKNTHK